MPINGLTGFGGGNGGILSGGVPDPTYAISSSTTSVDEGSSVTFTVTTTNVDNGTTLYWSINPVSGSINSSDFSGGSTSGNFTVNSNSASIAIGIANDTTTESGSDVFNLRIHTGSTGGPIVVTSVNVTINDTSQDPTQAVYHQGGTYSFVAPVIAAGTNVHVVCVGAGGGGDTSGGGGGGLAWKNNIGVSNGSSYTVQVGAVGATGGGPTRNGGPSYFVSTGEVHAYGGYGAVGTSSGSGRGYAAGHGGGTGGNGSPGPQWGGGGGGAAGYSGNGGNAGNLTGSSGSGGGGGGGGSHSPSDSNDSFRKGGGGGGVGLYGQGPNGLGAQNPNGYGGRGGSGGSYVNLSGAYGIPIYQSGGRYGNPGSTHIGGPGGTFGGGGGGANSTGWGGSGAYGGVRIIWGPGRGFPSTNAGYI